MLHELGVQERRQLAVLQVVLFRHIACHVIRPAAGLGSAVGTAAMHENLIIIWDRKKVIIVDMC